MTRVEVAMRLQLPQDNQQCENCHDAIMAYMTANNAFENIALLSKDPDNKADAELFFCFENPVSLNTLLGVMAQRGATVKSQYLMLPASLSGIASAYDARDYGAVVVATVRSVEGVLDATVSTIGSLRMECCTQHLDELLEQVIAALTNRAKH